MLPFLKRDVAFPLDGPKADRRGVTGDENYGLNKYGKGSDTPLPLPTYTSYDFPLLWGAYTFPLITLYTVTIPVGEMGALFSLPVYVVSFSLRWFFSGFSSGLFSSFW